ncbi:SusC/RagA family TonB-linked outer membrane protein [Pedobacter miscanthi]|nr:SusC/RagA family TonB-linked outer membrane protein [Pedobacter miscanthi]
MKLTIFIIILACMHVHADSFGQLITLKEKDAKIERIFSRLEKQSGVSFFYKDVVLKAMPVASINVSNVSLPDALDQLLGNSPLSFNIVDNTVVISKKDQTQLPANKMLLINGHVQDENGKPLPGITVTSKRTGTISQTDLQGQFTIIVPDSKESVVQFTCVGYESRELKLKAPILNLTVTMKQAVGSLDQVQILAYGTSTKRNLTGNVTTITASDIEKSPVQNVLQALQGRVPGLFIQQNTGLPGSSFNVTIRGGGSFFGANASPLYIVDGVTYPAGTTLPLLNGYINSSGQLTSPKGQGGNALNFLNVNDIESVTILKDADATTIYGSRGAYGVILITTKKGKAGKASLDFNVYTGINLPGQTAELLNTEQYLALRREALKNDGTTPGALDLDLTVFPQDAYTDWAKEGLRRSSSTTSSNLTLSGGNGATNYRISGNYQYQDSPQKGKGDVNTGGLSLNVNSKPIDKVLVDLSVGYTTDINTLIPFDLAGAGILTAPNHPAFVNSDGTLNWSETVNPYAALNAVSKVKTNNLLTTLTMNYMPVKGLNINGTIGYNYLSGNEFRAKPTSFFNPNQSNVNTLTTSDQNIYHQRTLNMDFNASYEVKTWKKGLLSLRSGLTLQDGLTYGLTTNGINFIADALLNNPGSAVTVTSTYSQLPNKYAGYFASARYTWDNKYILNLSGRYDGSTKFGPNKRFGLFGSLGASWIMSDYKWFRDNLGFISFAKLRGSIGTVGGDAIGNYQYLPTFVSSLAYLNKSTLRSIGISNPDLHWEKKREAEVGALFEFLKGRISLEGAYYTNRSSDLLSSYPLSSVTGYTFQVINSPALISSSGWEFSFNTKNISTSKFRWSTSVNMSIPKSKLLDFNGANLLNTNYEVGKPLTGTKVFHTTGVNPETGNYNFTNRFGETQEFGIFSAKQLDPILDKTIFIDLAPKYFGGINNSFSYGNFNLDVLIDFRNRMGNNFWGTQQFSIGISGQNSSVLALERWQKPGDVTDVPRATAGLGQLLKTNFNVSDGAYSRIITARISNVSLSYNFDEGMLKRIHLRRLNVFARGQNLFVFSNLDSHGLDPENLNLGAQGPLRVMTLGCNITL